MSENLKDVDKEEYFVFKIFSSVKEKFIKWITGYFIIVTALLSYVGIKTNSDISNSIKSQITSITKSKIDTIVAKKIKTKIDSISSENEKYYRKKIEKLNASLDLQLAVILSQRDSISKVKFNELINNINKTQTKKIPQIVINKINSGFLYYGIYKNKKWVENNFKNLTRGNEFPKVGDDIVTITPINIREKEIQYSKENGWINQKYLGTIKEGIKIKIKKVIVVDQTYIWVQF